MKKPNHEHHCYRTFPVTPVADSPQQRIQYMSHGKPCICHPPLSSWGMYVTHGCGGSNASAMPICRTGAQVQVRQVVARGTSSRPEARHTRPMGHSMPARRSFWVPRVPTAVEGRADRRLRARGCPGRVRRASADSADLEAAGADGRGGRGGGWRCAGTNRSGTRLRRRCNTKTQRRSPRRSRPVPMMARDLGDAARRRGTLASCWTCPRPDLVFARADGAATPAIRGRRRGTDNPWQFAGRWKNTDRPAHCASVWGNGSSSSRPWILLLVFVIPLDVPRSISCAPDVRS